MCVAGTRNSTPEGSAAVSRSSLHIWSIHLDSRLRGNERNKVYLVSRRLRSASSQAVKAWKTSPAMTPHPCPPQDEPAHKLYLDKCSLVNAARSGPLGSPGVKIEFKYKF